MSLRSGGGVAEEQDPGLPGWDCGMAWDERNRALIEHATTSSPALHDFSGDREFRQLTCIRKQRDTAHTPLGGLRWSFASIPSLRLCSGPSAFHPFGCAQGLRHSTPSAVLRAFGIPSLRLCSGPSAFHPFGCAQGLRRSIIPSFHHSIIPPNLASPTTGMYRHPPSSGSSGWGRAQLVCKVGRPPLSRPEPRRTGS
jgi:hypothetical protein